MYDYSQLYLDTHETNAAESSVASALGYSAWKCRMTSYILKGSSRLLGTSLMLVH